MVLSKENIQLKSEILLQSDGNSWKSERGSFDYTDKSAEAANELLACVQAELIEKNRTNYQLQEEVGSLRSLIQSANQSNGELQKQISILKTVESDLKSLTHQNAEKLQKKIGEQQLTIESLNESLLSRTQEYNLTKIELKETLAKLNQEIKSIKDAYDDVELEKICVENEFKNLKKNFEDTLQESLKLKDEEIQRLQLKLTKKEKEAMEYHQKYRVNEARIQALNDCVNELKKSSEQDGVFDSIETKTDLVLITKDCESLKDQLNASVAAQKSADDRVRELMTETQELKVYMDTIIKEKLESQTRLDILTSYFKEKESELQR